MGATGCGGGKQPGFLLDFFYGRGNSMQVTEAEGGKKIADFACGTEGTPCEIKTAGKKAMVSMWFNGPPSRWKPRAPTWLNGASRFFRRATSMEMEVIPDRA